MKPETELRVCSCGHFARASDPPCGYVIGMDRGIPDAHLPVFLCRQCRDLAGLSEPRQPRLTTKSGVK